jgi:predicted RNA binding protein YcfA (HicA-like mRNA interferase family)
MLNQKRSVRLLKEHGWARTAGGKHGIKMTKQGERPITLPHHRGADYSKGLTQAILKQAGIDWKESQWISPSSYIRNTRGTGQRSPSSRDASRQAER